MADIDLVPRHRSSTWIWWVIAAVVIVLLIVWATAGGSHRAAGPASELRGTAPAPAGPVYHAAAIERA